MPIKYIEYDIFKGGEDVIVHGCNCLCIMGAGIALQVAKYYPEAFMADKRTVIRDEKKLGTFTHWTGQNIFFPEKIVTVVNAYTQFDISRHKIPFDYDAFRNVIPKIKEAFEGKSIAFPKIGAGLAGGDWKVIEAIIEEAFPHETVKVYIYDK